MNWSDFYSKVKKDWQDEKSRPKKMSQDSHIVSSWIIFFSEHELAQERCMWKKIKTKKTSWDIRLKQSCSSLKELLGLSKLPMNCQVPASCLVSFVIKDHWSLSLSLFSFIYITFLELRSVFYAFNDTDMKRRRALGRSWKKMRNLRRLSIFSSKWWSRHEKRWERWSPRRTWKEMRKRGN